MTDFTTLDDIVDLYRITVPELARQLDEPELPEHVHAYISPMDPEVAQIGMSPTSQVHVGHIRNLSRSAMIRSIVIDCVTVARRLRRNRTIRPHAPAGHQPAWSCLASTLTFAIMRTGGFEGDFMRTLGPGRRRPGQIRQTIDGTLFANAGRSPNGLVSGSMHTILDGRISLYGKHRGSTEIHTRDGNEVAICIPRMAMPETVASNVRGMRLGDVLDCPLTEHLPDLPVLRIVNHAGHPDGKNGILKIFVADQRMPITRPPKDVDLSFVELGNEQLASLPNDSRHPVMIDPTILMPHDRSMHLATS